MRADVLLVGRSGSTKVILSSCPCVTSRMTRPISFKSTL